MGLSSRIFIVNNDLSIEKLNAYLDVFLNTEDLPYVDSYHESNQLLFKYKGAYRRSRIIIVKIIGGKFVYALAALLNLNILAENQISANC